MNVLKKLIIALVVLVVLIVIGIGIALKTIDANKYRGQIAEVLTKQTGRSVKLNGPISLGLSRHGIALTIQDASIGNPPWASRPNIAGIGHFELDVALMPLLSHELSVTKIEIANADILLESGAGNKHNWDMTPATQGKVEAKSSEKASGQSVTIQINRISISDSQLAIRSEDGKTSVFKVADMTFGHETGGVGLHFKGDYNGAPIRLDLKSGADDFTSTSSEPLDVELTYANYDVKAKGKASLGEKTAQIDSYSVSAGKSDIHGQLSAAWGGSMPSLQGTLLSDKLTPADFKPAVAAGGTGGAASPEPAANSQFVFSDAALPFGGLKSVNAIFSVNISELVVGTGALTNLTSKVNLNGGRLSAPVKFTLGKSPMSGELTINAAASPAQVSFVFSAPNADISDLLNFAGAPAFLSGKTNADINITSSGDSMHALASHANGKIDIIGAGGTISKSAAGSLSGGLMEILGGSSTLNCMAARFVATNGAVKDNGILLDTAATTIMGKGGFNLGTETSDLTLRARNKVVSAANILPPLHVGGTFAHPSFNIDSNTVVQNVAGALLSGSLSGMTDNTGVPDMQSAVGQNACVYTLDHPAPASAQKSVLNPSLAGQAQEKVKDVGTQLMKGLFGK